MKALKFVNVWLFLPITLGTHAMPGKFTPGKITNPVVCNADATQSYAVYVPVRGNSQPLPVIYMFDPHGDGALPLTKYRQLADVYGFILVGSNNSKNGNDWATTGNIWNNLYTDTQKKLKINGNRVYTCGFSGGAKVAGYIALEYSMVKSVIANSAALPDGIGAANYNFGFTGIAGTGDMNMTALAGFCKSLDNTTTRHRMLLFDGKHEWAPATTMQLAFEGLQLEAMQQGLMAKDDQLVARLAAQGRQKINALSNAGRWINAKQYCDIFYSYLNGLASDAAWFKQQANLIAAGKPYQAQQTQQDDLMNKEQQLEAGYMQQFRQGDEVYWAKTVGWLQKQAAANTAEGPMYQRVLAWLSLAFYSVSNQLITSNQDAAAKHFVTLYKITDPTNSEAWYFSAILNARAVLPAVAQADLLKAVGLGFNDKPRLEQQPEFRAAKVNIAAVESRMSAH